MTAAALAYLHPVTGGLILLLLGYAGWLGLRMASRPRERSSLLPRHRQLGPASFVLIVLAWTSGALSTLLLRADLEFAASLHFRVGTFTVVLLVGSAFTALRMRRGGTDAREIHPWLGATAILLAAAQFVTGLQITP